MGRLDQTSMVPSARSHLGSCTRKRQAYFKRPDTALYRAPGVSLWALVLVEGQNVEAHGIVAGMTLTIALNFPSDDKLSN